MFGIKPKVIVDEKKIDEFLTRGVENIFPNHDFLKSRLMKGERLSFYLGVDPTGPTLHLGHIIPLKKLAKLQELGHQIILLVGDFTAMIGDPTDKTATRKQLTREEVLNNLKKYKQQASKFISFSGQNAALFKYNSDWFNKMNLKGLLDLGSLITVDQMLKRDMFVKRAEEGKPVYIHELMYPIMQGYDSVAMNVDGEIGGNDQTFNMLVGRDLLKILKNKEKFVLATKLLIAQNGVKMGKTEGNMVSMDQSPEDMFGKVMSWSDDMIIIGFELATNVSSQELQKIKSEFENGTANPKEYKSLLAKEIVKMCHGEQDSIAAADRFVNTFSKGSFPDDAQIIEGENNQKLSDLLVEKGVIESKSEFTRLVEAGAVSIYPDNKITYKNQLVGDTELRLRIGKKVFVVIKPK